jgi:DNA polymerase-1
VKAIDTSTLRDGGSTTENLWIYNGLDCCITLEVLDALLPQLDNLTAGTYEFSRALQAPVLDMNTRGVLVDEEERWRVVAGYSKQIEFLQGQLYTILKEGLGVDINWRSSQQLKHLFYEVLGYAPIKKKGKITVDRDALEKLQLQFLARPIIAHILLLRDIAKKEGFLRTEIDADGRIRTSFNIAGTNTGRFSSSLSEFGTGTNLQNVEDQLRRVFVADPGYKLAYVDLEQAESRAVGAIIWNLFHDGRYLDACESGDLHTAVSKMAKPDLGWVSDNFADPMFVLNENRKIAERPYYRQHSLRHMCKVLGHGSNYMGQPYTMSVHTKIEASAIKDFQGRYFAAFPGIPRWHQHVAKELMEYGYLISLMGRKRWFFGRRNEASTIREAVAYDPQGSVGDILNRGLLQVWRSALVQLLLQVHDAILIQYPESEEDSILPQVLQTIQVPVELSHGRQLIIPSEAKVGWNWASWSEQNVDGLKKYKPGADNRRRERTPPTSKLDRLLCRVYV